MQLIAPLMALFSLGLLACAPPGLMAAVAPSEVTITPNGDGLDDEAFVPYRLTRPGRISAWLEDAAGQRYVLRRDEERPADDRDLRITGTYKPDPDLATERVLASGSYTLVIQASDGQREETQETQVTIRDADVVAPELAEVELQRSIISPNGDAVDDDTFLSYRLTKPALVSITVTDSSGRTYPLTREEEKNDASYSFRWEGTSQSQVLPNGDYVMHLIAKDLAGNVTENRLPVELVEGGTAKLEIVEARITPKAVPKGGILNIEIRVRNSGDTVVHTSCPPPGTAYTTDTNYNEFNCFELPGVWRVGVEWDLAGRPFPARWGLGGSLSPGEETTIKGTIQVNIDRQSVVRFWAGVEQGGVGFPGGQVSLTQIRVSF